MGRTTSDPLDGRAEEGRWKKNEATAMFAVASFAPNRDSRFKRLKGQQDISLFQYPHTDRRRSNQLKQRARIANAFLFQSLARDSVCLSHVHCIPTRLPCQSFSPQFW